MKRSITEVITSCSDFQAACDMAEAVVKYGTDAERKEANTALASLAISRVRERGETL